MYDPRSRGAESYIKLAKEILENEQAEPTSNAKRWVEGLSALLPARCRSPRPPLRQRPPTSAPEPCQLADRRDPAQSDAAADGVSAGSAGGTGGVDSGQRHHSAADRPATSGTAIRSSRASAAGEPRSSRDWRKSRWWFRMSPIRTAGTGADREHPARRSQPDRNRARLRAPQPRTGLSQEEIGRRTGKDRTSITNTCGF